MSEQFHLKISLIDKIKEDIKKYKFTHEKILSNKDFQIIQEGNDVLLKNYFDSIMNGARKGDYAEIIPTAFKELKSLLPHKYITTAICNETGYFPNFNHIVFLIANTPVMPEINWKHWKTPTMDVFNDDDGELDNCRRINPLVVDVVLKKVDFYNNITKEYHLDTLMSETHNPFKERSLDLKMRRGNFTPLAFSNKNKTHKNILIYLGINESKEGDLLQIGFREKEDYISFYDIHSKDLDNVVYQRNFCDENFEPIKGLPPQEDVLKYVDYLRSIPIKSIKANNLVT